MKKIILLLFTTILLNAIENKIGYPLHDIDVKEKTSVESKVILQKKFQEQITILSLEFDENNEYWYKTKYGFVYGKAVTTDVRYVNADLLHIRTKPSLQGIEISYFLEGDKVIVIQKMKASDGYNWVYTTEGFVASNYLTPSLVQEIIYPTKKIEIIKFREKPNKKSKVIKSIKKIKVKFIVQKAKIIDLSKSKKEIKKEQKIAVIKQKKTKEIIIIRKKIQKIKEIQKAQKIKEVEEAQEIKEIEEFKIKSTLNSIKYNISKTTNNYNQTQQIGKKLSKDGISLSIQANINFNYLPKNYLLFTSYEYISYTMRDKHNILFGTKKIFETNNNIFSPYIQAGIGLSRLNWTKDPLTSSASTIKSSNSLHYAVGIGGYYKLSKNFDIDIFLTQNFQNHTTKLTLGIQNSTIEDKSSLKYGLGLRYKF